MGLPTFQSVFMLVPCRYFLTSSGLVSASQTASTDALIVMRFSAVNDPFIGSALKHTHDEVAELTQVARLDDRVAVRRVAVHDRVGRVPSGARLGVQPEDTAGSPLSVASGLDTRRSAICWGLAPVDER